MQKRAYYTDGRNHHDDDCFRGLTEEALSEIETGPPTRRILEEERDDEPDLRELIVEALLEKGLLPMRHYRTEITGPTIRVAFLSGSVPVSAWDALICFDVASDGAGALRVAWRGDFAALELEQSRRVA